MPFIVKLIGAVLLLWLVVKTVLFLYNAFLGLFSVLPTLLGVGAVFFFLFWILKSGV
ncbi:hypothetical protein [uncultured Limosilactobacillus sp.]|uniref:hypothetical protein n=1 Tax=uncultured Limosilactobacillus sp. TaxID=2837629 RepID=UPI0025D7C950|nr:hypothetical protein [uncultured Limosilactobacillus sp.]